MTVASWRQQSEDVSRALGRRSYDDSAGLYGRGSGPAMKVEARGGMIVFILKRLAFLVVLLLAKSLLTFAATQILRAMSPISFSAVRDAEQVAEIE